MSIIYSHRQLELLKQIDKCTFISSFSTIKPKRYFKKNQVSAMNNDVDETFTLY